MRLETAISELRKALSEIRSLPDEMLAVALLAREVGKVGDAYLSGKDRKPHLISLAATAVALLQATDDEKDREYFVCPRSKQRISTEVCKGRINQRKRGCPTCKTGKAILAGGSPGDIGSQKKRSKVKLQRVEKNA